MGQSIIAKILIIKNRVLARVNFLRFGSPPAGGTDFVACKTGEDTGIGMTKKGRQDLKIVPDKTNSTGTIEDSGIEMSKNELGRIPF